jgi:16S rRNA (guanine527-N7)-methyltransferase
MEKNRSGRPSARGKPPARGGKPGRPAGGRDRTPRTRAPWRPSSVSPPRESPPRGEGASVGRPPRRESKPRPQPTQHPARAAERRSRFFKSSDLLGSQSITGHHAATASFESLVEQPDWADLVPAVERAGCDPRVALPRLTRYVSAILEWNRRVSNLISRNDESRLVSRHLAESLEPAGWLAQSGAERWIDLGSGAGFPALPLAIIGVGKKWLLVESRRPKALFLRRVVRDLEIESVHIAHSRLEELIERAEAGEVDSDVARAGGLPFDAFTSRAVIPFAPTLKLASRCLRVGGSAFLWKGSARDEEKASSGNWTEQWKAEPDIALRSSTVAVCNLRLIK